MMHIIKKDKNTIIGQSLSSRWAKTQLRVSPPHPQHHSHFDLQYSWVFSLYALSKGMVRKTQHSWYLVRRP